jgi:hypothetical protein
MELSKENCFVHCIKSSLKFTDSQIENIISQISESVNLFSVRSIKDINGLGYTIINDVEDSKHIMIYNKPNEIKQSQCNRD